jgi:glycosyltransferase involved in cell wall biosynthesis
VDQDQIRYSIIMPVYNGRKYFRDALQSAIAASGNNDEIIVVEDGSSDGGVAEIINKFSDQRIRYISQENLGVASALNTGLRAARNQYFVWLSHDDLFLHNRLNIDRPLRELFPNIVTYSSFYRYYEETRSLVQNKHAKNANSKYFASKLLSQSFVNGCTVTAPISLLFECGLFDERLLHTQDYDMWFKINDKTNFVYVPTASVVSRQHVDQTSVKLSINAKREIRLLIIRNIWRVATHPISWLELPRLCKKFYSG